MEIAFRASASIKAPFFPPRKTHFGTKRENAVFFPRSTFMVSPCVEAKAFTLPKEEIVSTLTQVEQAINQMEEIGTSFIGSGQQVYDSLIPSIDAAIDTAVPMVQQAGEDALNSASPVITNAIKMVQDAFGSSGLDSKSVVNAAKTVTSVAGQTIEEIKPIASSAVESISNSNPLLIAESAVGLFTAYLLPSVVSSILPKLRGYKGSLTPTQALSLTSTHSYYLIDIRSKDKNKAANNLPLPLPSTVKNRLIEIPLQQVPNKLRSLLQNARRMEAEMVALKILYLNHLTKSTNIVIIDSNSDSAKIVAKTLTSYGFKNCWIMADKWFLMK